jgi:hypothetical protein
MSTAEVQRVCALVPDGPPPDLGKDLTLARAVLGLPPGAHSAAAVKNLFRKLSLLVHADRFGPGEEAGADHAFRGKALSSSLQLYALFAPPHFRRFFFLVCAQLSRRLRTRSVVPPHRTSE